MKQRWINIFDLDGMSCRIEYRRENYGGAPYGGDRVLEAVGDKFVLRPYRPGELEQDGWYAFKVYVTAPSLSAPVLIRLTVVGAFYPGRPAGRLYIGDTSGESIGPNWSDPSADPAWRGQAVGPVAELDETWVEFYPFYPNYGATTMSFEFTIEVGTEPPFWTDFVLAEEEY